MVERNWRRDVSERGSLLASHDGRQRKREMAACLWGDMILEKHKGSKDRLPTSFAVNVTASTPPLIREASFASHAQRKI